MRRSVSGVVLTLTLGVAGCASSTTPSAAGPSAATSPAGQGSSPSASSSSGAAVDSSPGTLAATLPAALAGSVQTLHPGALTAQAISTAQTAFGLDLMAKVCGTDGPNTLISPASAADALGLLDAAARGGTADSLSHLLHLPTWNAAVVAAIHDHHSQLAALGTGTGDTVRTSNRVWPAVGNKPAQSYLDDVQTAYGATLQPLDYARQPQQATDTINRQVSEDTDGLIPRLFDQPASPQTVATLTNAIVLKATWAQPFLEQQAKSSFTTSSGSTSQVLQMDSSKPVSYAANSGWQAAQIPYRSGTLQAVALLPPAKAKACALPTAGQLAQLTASHPIETPRRSPSGDTRNPNTTSLTLPQMHLDQSHDLLALLGSMGLPLGGDYSGLGATMVSRAVQKDVLTVDQLGTVAAGATGVMVEASAPEAPKHAMTLDRPFLLLLEDTATHTPLFLASIGDPAST